MPKNLKPSEIENIQPPEEAHKGFNQSTLNILGVDTPDPVTTQRSQAEESSFVQRVIGTKPSSFVSDSITIAKDNWVYRSLFARDELENMPQQGNFNPDYNPFEKIKGTPYEDYNDAFKYVVNDKELEAQKARVDRELTTAQAYKQQGFLLSLPGIVAGGAMDPLTYIPLAGVLSKAGKMKSLWSVALLGGGLNAASALGSMSIEDSQRALKFTPEEYGMGVGAAGIFGAAITAGAGALTRNKILNALADEDVLTGIKAIQELGRLTEEEAVVASKTLREQKATQIESIRLKNEALVAGPLKATPVGQVLTSPFPTAKQELSKLTSHNLDLDGAVPAGPSFESQLGVVRQKADNLIIDIEDTWKISKQKGGKESLAEFQEQVGLVNRYKEQGLELPFGVSSEVRQAAKMVEDELQKARKALIESKIFTEDQLPKNYYPQIWSKASLEGRFNDFTNDVIGHYVDELEKAGLFSHDNRRAQIKFLEDFAERTYHRLVTGSALDAANPVQIALGIDNTYNQATLGKIFGKAGATKAANFLKERSINLPADKFGKYMINDPTRFMRRYMRSVYSDILSVKTFGTVDSKLIADNMVNSDLNKLLKNASPKEATKLNKAAMRTKDTITQMHQRITGRHKQQSGVRGFLSHAGEIVTNVSYSLTAGGIAMAQLGDLSKVALQYPIQRAYGKLLSNTFERITKTGLGGAQKQELVRIGVMGKKLSSSLIEDAMDLDFSANQRNYDGLMDWLSIEGLNDLSRIAADKTSVLSGMNFVMNQLETFTGSLAMDEIMRTSFAVRKGEKLTKQQSLMLKKTGITPEDAVDFAQEFSKRGGGVLDNGTYLTNTSKWNPEVASRFTAFIKTQIDEALSMPRQSTPFWMSGTNNRFFWMYKSFMMGALQNNFAAALQGDALHSSLYVASAIFFGNMSYLAREASKGNSLEEIDMSPKRLVLEGLDRSGLVTWMTEGAKYAEQITGNDPMTEYINMSKGFSRYRSRGAALSGVSPSTDLLFNRLPRFVNDAAIPTLKGRPTRKSIDAMQRMMIFNNVPYFAYPMNKIGDAIGEDLPQE